ncbi:IPT/TIG domain-containing protein [Flavobacterium sp. MK4S-17]|uniref:IPT/TIG domain-containing protein n=1 Tax=Flavobacterium sp. MK4S-17 TaxID=2543737 RepID=UPI001358E14A|nr:IPT/TIG domain-containing protein [Flavobacterium sp. MK4S-17]
MKTRLYKKITGILCMALAVFVLACDADIEVDKTFEEILGAQPTIESFSPGTAPIQGLVTIQGTYLNFVTRAYIGDAEAEIYSRENAKTMIIRVPANAVNGIIRLETNSDKVAESAEELIVTYPVPVIESTLPDQTTVNETITIEGENLQVITKVSFGNVDGVIELQDDRTIIVRTPNNNQSPMQLSYTYNTTSGEETIVLVESFTIYIPLPVVSSFPSAIIKNNPATITGQNMNLITSVLLGTTEVTDFTTAPGNLTFNPPASLASGSYAITLNYGEGEQIVSNAVPYINRDIETYFNFENHGTEVISSTSSVSSHLLVSTLNGSLPQPPFPGGSNYYHAEILSPNNNGSSIAYMRFTFSDNDTWKTVFDAGAFNDNPVLHFWLNTNNTTPTLRLYMTSSSSRKLVHYNTGSDWQLVAIRLRDLFPGVTASDFLSGNYMRMNYLSDNQAGVPLEVNADWFMITDAVLTEAGAVDVTDMFN